MTRIEDKNIKKRLVEEIMNRKPNHIHILIGLKKEKIIAILYTTYVYLLLMG